MAPGGPNRHEWSFAVFNNRHLLDVALWVSANSSELVTVRKIAAALGIADGTVRPVIDRLEKMGLVERIRGVSQEVPIVAREGELWAIVQRIEAVAPKAPQRTPSPGS